MTRLVVIGILALFLIITMPLPTVAQDGQETEETPPEGMHLSHRLPSDHPLATIPITYDVATGTEWGVLNGSKISPALIEIMAEPFKQDFYDLDVEYLVSGEGGVIGSDNRYRITNTGSTPYDSIVKIYFKKDSSTYAMCSGALVGDYHVLTAGHCVREGGSSSYYTDVWVLPGMNDGFYTYGFDQKPLLMNEYGAAKAVTFHTYSGWNNDGNYDHDFALIRIDRQLGDNVGSFTAKSLSTSSSYFTGSSRTAGYPSMLDNGRNMYYVYADSCSSSTYTHKHSMDMTGGQSGSPTWYTSGSTNYVYSVVSRTVAHYNSNGDHQDSFRQACSNMNTRITSGKYDNIVSWMSSDTTTPDLADLVEKVGKTGTLSSPDQSGYSALGQTLIRPGQTLTGGTTVRNVGSQASGYFDVDYYLTTDSILGDSDDEYVATVWNGYANALGSDQMHFSVSLPSSVSDGVYYIGWIIDPHSDVNELDESSTSNRGYLRGSQVRVDGTLPSVYQSVSKSTGTTGVQFSIYHSASDYGSQLTSVQTTYSFTNLLGTTSTGTVCTHYTSSSSHSDTCTYSGLQPGTYCFVTKANDSAGNTRTTSQSCKSSP